MNTRALSTAAAFLALAALNAPPVAGQTRIAASGATAPRIDMRAVEYAASTLAGSSSGFQEGNGAAAQFASPNGVAVDANGNLIVVDFGNQRIRKITPGGSVTTLAGGSIGFADGIGAAARFTSPSGVAVDPSGNVYVVDFGNQRIRKIAPNGAVSTVVGDGAKGFRDGNVAAAKFSFDHPALNDLSVSRLVPVRLDLRYTFFPTGIAVDASGNVFVADYGNHSIRKISAAGAVSTIAGNGTAGFRDGSGASAQFTDPSGIAVDAGGNLYVADEGNNRIRKITPAGFVTTLAGSGINGLQNGAAGEARFSAPTGLAVDASGDVFVADSNNNRIRKISPAGFVSTLPGTGVRLPTGIAVDPSGNIFVADTANNRIRKIAPAVR
jgi:sugar lactone lactonase YvrE